MHMAAIVSGEEGEGGEHAGSQAAALGQEEVAEVTFLHKLTAGAGVGSGWDTESVGGIQSQWVGYRVVGSGWDTEWWGPVGQPSGGAP